MESAIRVDSNIKLQIAVFATTAVSLNVSYRERINGVTKQPREANIASARITTDAAANYFYYQFYGDTDDVSELLNVAVGLATSGVQRGQCFVRVGLTIGGADGSNKDPFQVLFSDYVTSNSFLAYPGSPISDSLEGRGYFTRLTGTGTEEYTYTFANNIFTKLYSMLIVSVTSAAVANRNMFVDFQQFNGTSFAVQSTFNQTASTTKNFIVTPLGYSLTDITDHKYLTLPSNDMLFNSGGLITISPVNQDVDDSYSIGLIVEQWIKA